MPYTPPEFRKSAFNCPHCGAFAKMTWLKLIFYRSGDYPSTPFSFSQCSHCSKRAYWKKTGVTGETNEAAGKMIDPSGVTAPLPHPDMPELVLADYAEAREISGASPRAAAALLRLVVQKLCGELGESGENINADIGELVKKGLPVEIQKALDIIRVVGNNAVHPGELQPDDVADVASSLFELTNAIVEDRIARPRKLASLFASLPQGAREAIDKRDKEALDGNAGNSDENSGS